MERSRKEIERVEFLCNKYSSDSVDVAKLICDDHPSENLAFRIFDTDMKASNLSYGDLKKQSELLSKGLISKGIQSGDRIATLMGKSSEYIVTLMAIWRIGAVHVPLFTAFSTPAIVLRLNGSNAKIVICDETQQAMVKPSEEFRLNQKIEVITTGDILPLIKSCSILITTRLTTAILEAPLYLLIIALCVYEIEQTASISIIIVLVISSRHECIPFIVAFKIFNSSISFSKTN